MAQDLSIKHAILACVYEIQTNIRSEKYVSICFNNQATLKAIQTANTTSPLVWQCQKALNDTSTQHPVALYWVPGHAGVRGNEITNRLAEDGSVQKSVGPDPSLGVSTQNIKKKIKCWVDNADMHVCSFFLDREDIKSQSLRAIWDFGKRTGLP